MKKISGNIVDLVNRRIYQGTLHIADDKIVGIIEEKVDQKHYILPGLIDAHIHIESSMLPPAEFARLAVVHGTVASVSDPHEIANVLGINGIRFMIENGKKVPFKFYFGASSCVPATSFETSGATLDAKDIDELLQNDDIKYLSEMMNYPGVLNKDPLVMTKIELAKKYQKPVDGHAPGLMGDDARQYIQAGISTDHECFTLEEAFEKIKYGMKVQIREGSAAKNFDALIPLIESHPEKVMFCSDDRHPDDLVREHINNHVKRALQKGYDLFDVLRAATLNPIEHYGLDVGLLRQGNDADFIIVDDLKNFNVLYTYVSGDLVYDKGKSKIPRVNFTPENNFYNNGIKASELYLKPKGKNINVIDTLDGQLITKRTGAMIKTRNGNVVSNPDNDILKLAVLNRYEKAPPAIGFVRGFGLKHGAIASTVAHDSHNIIATGTSEELLANAINLLVESGGGISVCDDSGDSMILPLPLAGLMSEEDGYQVAEKYEQIDRKAKALGSKLQAPFMTLSFMALLVIPELKLSDKGLFDGREFVFTSLFTS